MLPQKCSALPMTQVSVQPVAQNQLPGLLDQVTRHHIEEIGNLEVILPQLYARYSKLGAVQAAVADAGDSKTGP